ncbi:MAG TPA: 5-dehydro-4-deoxyglucarate dehydratase [Actinophytocola sp.]|uniref:5-dehydro-4-deoxyglucarate dehydratase n=1 Tax=Actinophytocola sp. TaxID=1872138 RepID=UPI002DDD5B4B|nr:5-dehydro-4-deoxyglucarate dehydratase [Actinophytocola sp.]HEV2782375.1 5-dehydro-4-deoxyglucarate dehydratase [Actinophytocola sp.]
MHLTGLLSFPLTPFTADDTVATGVLAEHVAAHVAAEPAGLFVACGTGELTALSIAEYREVLSTARRVVDGRMPVFAGVGGGPRIAREFLTVAAESGVDGVLLLPPYLVHGPPAGMVDFVRYVAAAAPLPIVVYQRANAILDPAAAVALLDLPTVIGIKDGEGDLDRMRALIDAVRTSGHPRAAEFGFLNGLPTAELSVPAYRALGVDGYSSAVLCFVPEIATAFYAAVEREDAETVQTLMDEFYVPFAALRETTPGYAVALVKAGARLRGQPVGPVRPPLRDVTAEHLAQLEEIIARGRAALANIKAVA